MRCHHCIDPTDRILFGVIEYSLQGHSCNWPSGFSDLDQWAMKQCVFLKESTCTYIGYSLAMSSRGKGGSARTVLFYSSLNVLLSARFQFMESLFLQLLS